MARLVARKGTGEVAHLLSSSSSGVTSIYLGNGTGQFTFQSGLINPLDITVFDLVADLNGDGIPDIAALAGDSVQIFLGMGRATYATPFYIGTGPAPFEILVENLHGQSPSAGLPDIVEPDQSGGVTVLINKTK